MVGNPANTNCLLASKMAPSIPSANFTCLTRLDQNRAVSQVRSLGHSDPCGIRGFCHPQIAAKVGVPNDAVGNVIIWGNHSSTQFPDAAHGFVQSNGQQTPIYAAVQDDAWLKGEFIKVIPLSRSRHRSL